MLADDFGRRGKTFLMELSFLIYYWSAPKFHFMLLKSFSIHDASHGRLIYKLYTIYRLSVCRGQHNTSFYFPKYNRVEKS